MRREKTKPPVTNLQNAPTAVDLYCGCGGVTEGLKDTFNIIAAIDNNPVACQTYRLNHPNIRLFENDINDVDPQSLKDDLLPTTDLDLLIICAPCQPFSSQNRTNSKDSRDSLILKAIDFAKVLKPKLIFFENVPGIRRQKFASLLDQLCSKLQQQGYCLTNPQQINAADYGVPQRRLRCIMLAKRVGTPPSLPNPATPNGKRLTVRKVIDGLPKLNSGQAAANDPLHFARNHRYIALQRLAHIPKDGGSRSSLPDHLKLACHKKHKGHPDVYGRMKWDEIAPTLTTGCTDITRGRFAHPESDRAITLREAARLQTFPDEYRFCGSPSDIAIQVGNAVPVHLIRELAPTFLKAVRT